MSEGVSFVVPVHNGRACVRDALESIVAQADGRPMEIVVVDDASQDDSSAVLLQLAGIWPLQIVEGDGRGAAAAINIGVRAARFPIICQVDQDVVLRPGWMRSLVAELGDPSVGAVQGYYASDPGATLFARAMGFDLEQRYAAIDGRETGHVCTGNSAYRSDALRNVGLFDETFGYGYDNDMSYRLRSAGYRLTFCREAQSVHRWREGMIGYLRQQYGFGYGRIDLVAKHPRRLAGDSVSPAGMMSHPLLMAMAIVNLGLALFAGVAHGPWRPFGLVSTTLVAGLALERLAAGISAARRFGTLTPLVFPVLHLGRDLAWVAAIAMWLLRRVARRPSSPVHSMRPRARVVPAFEMAPAAPQIHATRPLRTRRILGLIPAHNEALNLVTVVAELRASWPDLDVLIVDDGSTDQTSALLPTLGVRWLQFPERMGIGSAMRAGLRYAARLGYDVVVRLDGDGQHRAADIELLLGPINEGVADVVLGSRFSHPNAERAGIVRLGQRLLAACLSGLTGNSVTDPTSGFCVLGPRAVRVLAEHHPTGYAEPELRLFLSRNALRAVEVPVRGRPRLNGKTSLTLGRVIGAGGRVILAMLVVPLRRRVGALAGD
jgi:glycosyltransferase involved in cell wall biosynthesis